MICRCFPPFSSSQIPACLSLAASLVAAPAALSQHLPGNPAAPPAEPRSTGVADPHGQARPESEPASLAEDLPEAPRPVIAAPTASDSAPENISSGTTSVGSSSSAEEPDGAQVPGDVPRGRVYPRTAAPTDVVVLPGQIGPHQTAEDKLLSAARNAIDPSSLVGEVISGGYSQLVNGSPNYGTNAIAFGQRFGAAAARGNSQNLFYRGATSILFREDARYYMLGDRKPFFHRVAYAMTRPIVTRTDSGRTTPNFALLTAYLGAAALTKVYYPPANQGFHQTLITYGGSLGGASLGYIADEFLADALQFLHLKKSNIP